MGDLWSIGFRSQRRDMKTERALLSPGMEQCILEVVGDSGRRGVLYGFITMG